ncbi:MAG: universal stress protein [Vicingus serpentipes]|nr:universal stress protein [Vicingus serpentipes]
MKNILVPTDFSECAHHAAEVAVQIAKEASATIHLLHVVDIPLTSYDAGMHTYENIPETMFLMNHAKESMEKLKNETMFNGVEVTTMVEFDLTYSRITNEAKEKNVDLIVMGSHGASGFQELMIGSNAERVVRFAACPVLTIKKKHTKFDIQNIVLASDFKEDSAPFFDHFSAFIKLFDAHIHLLKVNTALNFEITPVSRKLMESFLIKHDVKNSSTHIYNDESEEDGILNFAEEVDADLIAIGTHGRTGLSHLVNGSLAESVINHAGRPVLSIKI